ncbi:hypothetical protein [Deinococcus alpinitundrae]|uniref:hypothetical protein n=1 Tax=Deinococcus alpinitundrae TaxID=468913 RepID=UPI00137AC2AA|nr:hypothetical protein [Deinococcus alpinitundrae]
MLNHPEALALLTWLDALHLHLPVANPSLHLAMTKLQAAQGQDANLVEGSGRAYGLIPQDESISFV